MKKYVIYEHNGTKEGMWIEPKWDYEPQNDITIYELALITPALFTGNWITQSQMIQKLPSKAQRHFKIEDGWE